MNWRDIWYELQDLWDMLFSWVGKVMRSLWAVWKIRGGRP